MPIPNIVQPQILNIDETLRLRKFDDQFAFAFSWYQDPELVYLVDGVKRPYSQQTLSNMYHYLDKQGELYFIEVLEHGKWKPVGDVCFWQEDLPIVIGEPGYRGNGVGKRVIQALLRRGKELGWSRMGVREIYAYNVPSQKCFENCGFRICETTKDGYRFQIDL